MVLNQLVILYLSYQKSTHFEFQCLHYPYYLYRSCMLLIYHVLNLCLVSTYLVLSLNQKDLTVLNLIGTVKLEENVWKRRWKLSCTYRAIPRFDVMVCYCARLAELKCGAMDALWPSPWKLVWSCLSTINSMVQTISWDGASSIWLH